MTPTLLSDCNNKAHIVTIGECEYFFSYATCIAFRGTSNGEYRKVRLANHWGPTTGKHFNKLECAHFEIKTDAEFHDIVEGSVAK